MESMMLRINQLGSIEQVIWRNPDRPDAGTARTVFQLFSAEAKSPLLKVMKRSAQRDDASFCDEPLPLTDRTATLSACMVSMGKWLLFFAYDHALNESGGHGDGIRAIILMFMNMLKNCVSNTEAFSRPAPGSEQIEMIQTLMSELRERKRLLEDANTQLNAMNLELNNRLVKDSLTGLVSRYQYRAEMEYLIGKQPDKLGVFVFIDIDDFKSINDKYGHATGDKYLVEFAARLKRLPIKDIVCMRISGDEFGLFLHGVEGNSQQAMEEIWKQLKHHVLSGPIVVDGRSLPLAISAGMAVYGVDTMEIYDLIECADQAMYNAKRMGKNRYSVYSGH